MAVRTCMDVPGIDRLQSISFRIWAFQVSVVDPVCCNSRPSTHVSRETREDVGGNRNVGWDGY